MKTPDLLERGFEVLGQIHDVWRAATLPPAADDPGWANWISAGTAAPATRRGAQRLRRLGSDRLQALADRSERLIDAVAAHEAQFADDVRMQHVHGDFWDGNVGFVDGVDGPEIAALLDVGFLGRRPRIDDMALTVWFWLLEPGQGRPGTAHARCIRRWLDAYDRGTTSALTTAERAALPGAVARQIAWSIGGWVVRLDAGDARRHAVAALDELPVAEAVWGEVERWQELLTRTP